VRKVEIPKPAHSLGAEVFGKVAAAETAATVREFAERAIAALQTSPK
jgi:hypothetical protein